MLGGSHAGKYGITLKDGATTAKWAVELQVSTKKNWKSRGYQVSSCAIFFHHCNYSNCLLLLLLLLPLLLLLLHASCT
jgi:hypothetical protein